MKNNWSTFVLTMRVVIEIRIFHGPIAGELIIYISKFLRLDEHLDHDKEKVNDCSSVPYYFNGH